jgi:hypothetical protein
MNDKMEIKCNEAFSVEISEGFFVISLISDAVIR